MGEVAARLRPTTHDSESVMTPEPKSTTATSSATKAAAKPKPQAQADRPAVASPLEVALSCLEKPKTVSKSAAVMEVDTHCEAPNRYTNYQVAVLTSAYEMTVKPTRAQHKALAKALDLTEKQSKIWFQNKRQRCPLTWGSGRRSPRCSRRCRRRSTRATSWR